MADINSQLPVKLTDGTLTATIRDAGTNDALNVAVVDAAGNQVTSFSGGGTQYAEDVASVGAESLTLAGAVRRDTAASSSTTDGDYSTINTDSAGRLWVNASGATVPVTVTAGATSPSKAEDVASADADVGIPAMAIRKAAPANTSSTDGDYEMLQMSAGRLWVDASGTTLTVGSHAVTVASGATSFVAAEDDASANLDAGVKTLAVRKATPADTSGTDGDYEFLQMSAGRLWTSSKIDNTAANPIPTYNVEPVITGEFNDYDTTASVAAAATDNHDYTVVTNARLKQITASSSGKMKVVLSVGPVASLVVKGTWFTSTANPNLDITFAQPIEVPNTSTGTIRIARTNLEASSMDVYSLALGIDS